MAIAPLGSGTDTTAPSDYWLGIGQLIERATDTVLLVAPEHFEHARSLNSKMVVVSWDGDPSVLDPEPFRARNVVAWPPYPGNTAFESIAPALRVVHRAAKKVMLVKPDEAEEQRSVADFNIGEGSAAAAWAKGKSSTGRARLIEFTAKPPPATRDPNTPRATVSAIPTRAMEITQRLLELDPLPPEFSDDALALAFTEATRERWRYVAAWGKWMVWTGNRWGEDRVLGAVDQARSIGRRAANNAATNPSLSPSLQNRIAHRCTDKRIIMNMVALAAADPAHARLPEDFDANQWALNTPGGVVDLTDGSLRPHRSDDYVTKITRATPTHHAECPRWLAFLRQIMGGDESLVAFLQRVIGYCLTGSIREHALFFCYGTGANGKGTFLNTLQWLLGDYAMSADMEMFTERRHEPHKQELARLCGARMVTAQETEEGRRWAEAKIKKMTGGDSITANYMRRDDFEFTPQFKLMLAGNHKPSLRTIDEAIRRRMNLIPFEVTIPAEERDGALPDKLKEEADGILRWAVDGCMQWQRLGLAPPKRVTDATNEYLEGEDAVARWLTEQCEIDKNARGTQRAQAYRSYRQWCEGSGEFCLPLKRWLDSLRTKGIDDGPRSNGYPTLLGFRLRVEASDYGQGRWPDD